MLEYNGSTLIYQKSLAKLVEENCSDELTATAFKSAIRTRFDEKKAADEFIELILKCELKGIDLEVALIKRLENRL